jgi:ATP-binding cassette subfamily B protein
LPSAVTSTSVGDARGSRARPTGSAQLIQANSSSRTAATPPPIIQGRRRHSGGRGGATGAGGGSAPSTGVLGSRLSLTRIFMRAVSAANAEEIWRGSEGARRVRPAAPLRQWRLAERSPHLAPLAMADTEHEGEKRRVLSNRQVLAFVVRQWRRRPKLFAVTAGFMLLATLCDLSIPWAAGRPDRRGGRSGAAGGRGVGRLGGAGRHLRAVLQPQTGGVADDERFRRPQHGGDDQRGLRAGAVLLLDWHADTFAGSTVRKVTRAMWGYDNISDTLILMLGPALLVLFGLSASMFVRDAWPAWSRWCSWLIYMALSVWLTQRYIRPGQPDLQRAGFEAGRRSGGRHRRGAAIKSFGAEERESARFAETTGAWRAASIRTWNRFADNALVMNVLTAILQASMTGILVLAWAQGRAEPGDVAFAVTAYMLMAGYLRTSATWCAACRRASTTWRMSPPSRARRPRWTTGPARRPSGRQGEIAFEDVTFRYKNALEPLYEGFSLRIAPGERVALVGPTGAGKSTFVKLVQRLYDVQGGRILIDGQDVSQVRQATLRPALAVVPQDPALFHRAIAENIAYGRPEATADEIKLAARRARAHDFIMRLPKGYDTLVGERGVKLSGGERQRVAIARAFLADAPILVLDEATSSLDVETERQVQAAMDELMEGRTTIVIAHRLSTIRGADRILVFHDGRVVEEGRHGELLSRGGAYARLSAVAEGAA